MSRPPDSQPRHTLPASHRLRRKLDFQRVFDARCSVADGRLVLYVAANDLGHVRVAFPVSRRLGNAVRRNRIRRLMREAFRLGRHDLPDGFDYILIPRHGRGASLVNFQGSLQRLAPQAVEKWRNRPAAPSPASPERTDER